VLTILTTSDRVAPGLLSWQAWTALRDASRVLVGSAEHPQLPALAEAGIAVEIVTTSSATLASSATPPSPVISASSATPASTAVPASPAGSVVWLAAAGQEAPSAELLAALGRAGLPVDDVRVLHGSHDLPGAHLIDVVSTMNTLRTSCPWDRRQTHESLAPHLLEEPYEALEALENGDHQALREELGDVLLQVVFHARIAADRPAASDGYTIDDVADTLVAKLIRRHPHVFAGVAAESADDVIRNWDEIKKAERAAKLAAAAPGTGSPPSPPSVLDGVVLSQPALSLAAQVLRRAARISYPATAAAGAATAAGAAAPRPSADGQDSDADGPDLGEQLLRLVGHAAERGLDSELELRRAARNLARQVRDWELRQP
jgi:XTP/dITP diphosphohydrolase